MVGLDAMRRRTKRALSILDLGGNRSESENTRTISGSVINVRRFHQRRGFSSSWHFQGSDDPAAQELSALMKFHIETLFRCPRKHLANV